MDRSEREDQVCHLPTDLIRRVGGGLKALVLACLWSNPSINATGCTPKAIPSLSEYTGMAGADVEEALRELEEMGEAKVDWGTGEALVPSWLEHNYLQERSVAERPEFVLEAVGQLQSAALRGFLLKEVARLDVQYDAEHSV